MVRRKSKFDHIKYNEKKMSLKSILDIPLIQLNSEQEEWRRSEKW